LGATIKGFRHLPRQKIRGVMQIIVAINGKFMGFRLLANYLVVLIEQAIADIK
jgi:hypothetical protein